VRLEGLIPLKNPVSSSGYELATFRLVAQCLFQVRYRVPPNHGETHKKQSSNEYCLLECNTLKHVLLAACLLLISCFTSSWNVIMEVVHSSKSSMDFHQTAGCRDPERSTLHCHHCGISNSKNSQALRLPQSSLCDNLFGAVHPNKFPEGRGSQYAHIHAL
jgi:hypothetical protein